MHFVHTSRGCFARAGESQGRASRRALLVRSSDAIGHDDYYWPRTGSRRGLVLLRRVRRLKDGVGRSSRTDQACRCRGVGCMVAGGCAVGSRRVVPSLGTERGRDRRAGGGCRNKSPKRAPRVPANAATTPLHESRRPTSPWPGRSIRSPRRLTPGCLCADSAAGAPSALLGSVPRSRGTYQAAGAHRTPAPVVAPSIFWAPSAASKWWQLPIA